MRNERETAVFGCDGVKVVSVGIYDEYEIAAYVERGREQYGRDLREIHLELDEDEEYVNITYKFHNTPFHRIRRITGYLVGTLDRFNNAKRSEERDRTKHRAE